MSNTVGYTDLPHYKGLEDLDNTYTLKTTSSLRLLYCGMEKCRPGHRFGPYVRENYVIHLITDGSGYFKTECMVDKVMINKGEAFLIRPGQSAKYSANREDPWTYVWFGFNGNLSERMIAEMGFSGSRQVISVGNTEPVNDYLQRIFEAKDLTPANELRRDAAFYDALAWIMDASGNNKTYEGMTDYKYVNMAVDMITTSYNEKIRISEIADRIGINRSYLTSIFKKQMNMSPQEYLINCRLEKAAELLRDTEETITNIASSVGYSDSLALSKAFKQRYGISPSMYRNAKPELILSESYERSTNL